MKYKKITRRDLSGVGVIGLPDTPELSTEDMQAKFEQTAREVIIPRHNRLIDRLTERGQPVESENLLRLKKGEDGDLLMSPDGSKWEKVAEKALSQKRDSSSVFTKEETLGRIDRKVVEIGSADMAKAIYDTDGDGVIDRAKTADTASAAAKLSSPRTINRASFDGSGNIDIRDAISYRLGGTGDKRYYTAFARIKKGSLSKTRSGATMLISGLGDYGSVTTGVYLVEISNRGGSLTVSYSLLMDNSNAERGSLRDIVVFGAYTDGDYEYRCVYTDAFRKAFDIVVLSAEEGFELGKFYDSSSAPSGWTPNGKEKSIVGMIPASGAAVAKSSDELNSVRGTGAVNIPDSTFEPWNENGDKVVFQYDSGIERTQIAWAKDTLAYRVNDSNNHDPNGWSGWRYLMTKAGGAFTGNVLAYNGNRNNGIRNIQVYDSAGKTAQNTNNIVMIRK